LRVELLELLHVVHAAGVLCGADGAPVERIEDEHDALLAGEVTEPYFLLVLVLERKLGCGCADGCRHLFLRKNWFR